MAQTFPDATVRRRSGTRLDYLAWYNNLGLIGFSSSSVVPTLHDVCRFLKTSLDKVWTKGIRSSLMQLDAVEGGAQQGLVKLSKSQAPAGFSQKSLWKYITLTPLG